MAARAKNGLERFSTVAIVLHWVIALLVISNLVLAKVAEGLKGAERGALMGAHTALGMAVLAFSVLLAYHPRPARLSRTAGRLGTPIEQRGQGGVLPADRGYSAVRLADGFRP